MKGIANGEPRMTKRERKKIWKGILGTPNPEGNRKTRRAKTESHGRGRAFAVSDFPKSLFGKIGNQIKRNPSYWKMFDLKKFKIGNKKARAKKVVTV